VLSRLILFLALLLAPELTHARGIEPEMLAEHSATPGGEVELAIHMRTKPGWHGYWLNPGDAGLPMAIDWSLPKGASVGPLRYPVPTRLTIAGLMNYVFEEDYAVLLRLKVPERASGLLPIRASARWLACTDKICVPESGELSLDLPVGTGSPDRRAQFDEWRRTLPQPLSSRARFQLTPDRLRLAIPLPRSVNVENAYVFPASSDGGVNYAAEQQFHRKGDTIIADLPRKAGDAKAFSGVLALGDGRGLDFTAVPGTVTEGGTRLGALDAKAVLLAVLGALAGGLLLNLMPCVFPILTLKALHLARSGGEEREARRDALAYAAGAVAGTAALGIAILLIRAGGTAVGWAFQLQDPRTILLLFLLSLAITLNLLRVFELPAMGGRTRPAGGFGTGLLAAFVATPCAGPFMGAALGTALLLPAAGAVLVFAALGLGLAIPFLLIGFVPALRRKLPQPGAWMARLQRFLAIPMAATAVACLWLLYRQGGQSALGIGLAAAAVLLLILWWTGRRQRFGQTVGWVAPALGIAVIVVGAVLIGLLTTRPTTVAVGGQSWSEAKVAATLEDGRPSFVYFTADWCLTCKANEAGAIGREDVEKAFDEARVEVLVGDWTNGDPAITRFLESRGRAGVPLYLWYDPGKPAVELPQVLTPGMLIDRARRR
jgi:DsbC/DsbD-like thiol-disulfide interchange protein/cytochrome c biogenesis protein CcdA